MDLGAFSLSLTVKDLEASKVFYQKLGFSIYHDQTPDNWVIMMNGDCTIGLFQGMFEKNILTFNPGWDRFARPLDPFTDIRELQKELRSQGINIDVEANENDEGPASLIITDPDGNPIMLDQHV